MGKVLVVSCGLLPELKLFYPISNALEEVSDNKNDSLKVIKTSPFLFPAETEASPRESKEPNHSGAQCGVTLLAGNEDI